MCNNMIQLEHLGSRPFPNQWHMRLFLGIAWLLSANVVMAQQLGKGVGCVKCQIETRVVATLGEFQGPGSLAGSVAAITADGQGRYWVVSGDAVLVFASDGRYVASVGRRGSGPGEYGLPTHIVSLPGDSVALFDHGMRRITVFGPDFKPSRTISLPSILLWNVALLRWPDAVILNGLVSSADNIGWPFHTVDLSTDVAAVRRSFGSNDGIYTMKDTPDLMHRIAADSRGGLWAARVNTYSISRWMPDGTRIVSFDLKPEWFKSKSNYYSPGSKSEPPPPRVHGILAADRDDLAWVLTLVPHTSWRSAWMGRPDLPTGRGQEVPTTAFPPPNDLFQTRVELLNSKGDVVASRVLPVLALTSLAGNRVAVFARNTVGNLGLQITVLQLSLVEQR